MKRLIAVLFLGLFASTADSAVRWNPNTRMWEGNICMNNYGWQTVNWQPLGSMCMMSLPGLGATQGVIINA